MLGRTVSVWQDLVEEAMGDDAESGKVLRAVHKNVVDQQLGPAMKLLGAAKSAHRNEAGVVHELVSKQPRPTSGQTTKEGGVRVEGLRLGAASDGGGAVSKRIEVPDDVLKQVVCALKESSAPGCSVGYKELKRIFSYHHMPAHTAQSRVVSTIIRMPRAVSSYMVRAAQASPDSVGFG